MSTQQHWGEIPKNQTNFIPDVTADIERSMDKCCLTQFEDEEFVFQNEQVTLPSMDPLMLYAISLHKYANDMTEMIRVAELATEMNLIPPEEAPPMPQMPEVKVTHKPNALNFIPKDFTSSFSTGCDVQVPELSDAIVRQILTKCIATMFAHIGFETSHQSVLDVLGDVLEAFFKTICHKLKVAVEDDEMKRVSGFPHTIERVLTETGLGGVKGIHDYYQNRVLKYLNVLQKRCAELNDRYAMVLIPKSPSPNDNKPVRVKVEEDDDVMEVVDNTELHFTTIDGEVCPSLEPGYQLLNSLEAETNLQSFGETEEEM